MVPLLVNLAPLVIQENKARRGLGAAALFIHPTSVGFFPTKQQQPEFILFRTRQPPRHILQSHSFFLNKHTRRFAELAVADAPHGAYGHGSFLDL